MSGSGVEPVALRLGTRGSLLATAQSGLVARAITAATGVPVELVPITTHGDVTAGSLASLGGTGVFATALREALLAGDCDLVVHSMKDLPTAAFPGLALGAVPRRAAARDVLCARDGLGLDDLPPGARVGTSAPRRAAQVLRRRPDVAVVDIRGNVDTRLRRIDDGVFDAIVLAEAGLARIGREAAVVEAFPLASWPTAAAQGALAVEVRAEEATDVLGAALHALHDPASAATALVEREVLARLEAGCAAPVGIASIVEHGVVRIVAEVYRPDGRDHVRVEATHAADALAGAEVRAELAARIVGELLAGGAAALAGLSGARG